MPTDTDNASVLADRGGSRTRWLLAAAAGGIIAAVAARRALRIARVPAELRSPILYVPYTMNALTRPIMQRLTEIVPMSKPDGMRIMTHDVPRGEGEPTTRLMTFEREGSSGLRPVLFWIHGGGYVIGTPEQDVSFISRLLARFDIVVASVDYRLAPDHPFPAPLDDCHAALAWVVHHAGKLGVDADRVIIGGQSAGGGLAAALVQRTVDQGPVAPIFQLLIYPMLDAKTVAREDDAGTGDFIWTANSNRYGWQSYLGADPTSGSYPDYAVPSARADLSRLPPAWIGVGSLDLFHDEDRVYAERLRQAGVNCEFVMIDGGYHAFDALMPDAAATKRFNNSIFSALQKALC